METSRSPSTGSESGISVSRNRYGDWKSFRSCNL